MNLNNNIFFSFVFSLFLLFFFLKSPQIRSSPEENNCIIAISGSEVNPFLQLGETIQLSVQATCPISDITTINWEPAIGMSCTDCLAPFITPLQDQCYTLNISWQDGCVSTEEVCLNLKDCENDFSENRIVSITPTQIETEATIELEIAREQFVHIVTVEDNITQFVIWEGWIKPGLKTLSLDFSNVPSGTHNLKVQLYPDDKFITIEVI